MRCAPVCVETVSLDILHRAGWRPVSRDAVTAWYADRARHADDCPCWRCEAAAKANPKTVWRCLRNWEWSA